jgi:uncharacterized protein YeaO (DUF488 family)
MQHQEEIIHKVKADMDQLIKEITASDELRKALKADLRRCQKMLRILGDNRSRKTLSISKITKTQTEAQ